MTSTERHEARYQRRKAKREAKRRALLDQYDNFDLATSPIALIDAHFDTRKGVLWKYSPALYNAKYIRYSSSASKKLQDGEFKPGGYYYFPIIERGKLREVHSLHYTERVVRRSFCVNCFVPILSHNLIYDNSACLKGKGVSFAEKRIIEHLTSFYNTYHTNQGYAIIVDFKNYFGNINHEKLFEKVFDRYFLDERLNHIAKQFVQSTDKDKLKPQKGVGLFIGPEDSQIFAVSYPNGIDHYIKDTLRMKWYGRYNDDSYILVRDKDAAKRILNLLYAKYEEYGIIQNKKKTQIVKLSRGFTYLKTKYSMTETGKIIRRPCRANITRQRRKLKSFSKYLKAGEITIEEICQSYMSFRGHIKTRKHSGRSVLAMDNLFVELFHCRPWKRK